MSNEEYGNLRAFPVPGAQGEGRNGMTIRTWLAGMAMQAQLANPYTGKNYAEQRHMSAEETAAWISKNAVLAADGLIAALNHERK